MKQRINPEQKRAAGKKGKANSPWRRGNVMGMDSRIRAIAAGFDPNRKERRNVQQ